MIDTLNLHGSFGSPFENWFPWLASTLSERGHRVLVPHFPDRELQNLSNWKTILDSYTKFLSQDLLVYAHSSAPAFIVDYCVDRNRSLKKAIFVVPFYGLIGIDEFDNVNKTFFVDKQYLVKFKDLCKDIVCIYSNDDPYVPQSMSEEFATATGAKTHVILGGKHLNANSGFSVFPLLSAI